MLGMPKGGLGTLGPAAMEQPHFSLGNQAVRLSLLFLTMHLSLRKPTEPAAMKVEMGASYK